MKEYLLNLAKYQRWANNRYRETLRKLDFENFKIKTPYGDLLHDIVHIFGAVELWMKRIEGISPKNIRSSENYLDWESVKKDWVDTDNQLINFINSLDEGSLNNEISYTSIQGVKLKTTLDNILIQLLTHHQSYHRGQIGMFLREKGFEPVRATDYIYYVYD